MELTDDGSPASALLLAARASPHEKTLADLLAEAERVKAKIAQDKRQREARLSNAADALAEGRSGEVDPVTALLLRARAENAERDAKRAATPPKAPPPRLETAAAFIVDPSGNVAAPAPSVESTAPTPPPFQADEPAPAPAPAKRARKPTGFPAFDAFSDAKAKERADLLEQIRQRSPGGRLSAQDAFPPDAPGTGPQGHPEHVTFTRVPGGRGIRRVG